MQDLLLLSSRLPPFPGHLEATRPKALGKVAREILVA
jgi:hypothetical protein